MTRETFNVKPSTRFTNDASRVSSPPPAACFSILLGCLLLLSGCGSVPPWVPVNGVYSPDTHEFVVELPAGWRHSTVVIKKDPTLLRALTREGFSLQTITILKRLVSSDWPNTRKKVTPGMLPQEVAEVFLDNFRANPTLTHQQVLDQGPATLGGRPGFLVHYAYRVRSGLMKQGLCYGAVIDGALYALLYEAPTRHYFARDLPTFDTLKESFHVGSNGQKS